MNEKKESNRLITTTSPYLLQHAYNPVEWYPWGVEALDRARKEDKLILVSIGYSSCHWCHVMERESFENDSIAAIMNKHFINIKVDREERPDIDQVYMEAVQAMGIGGGWPLNVFLTPEQKPFYGGTYFPPETWARILHSLAVSFREKRSDIEKAANSVTEHLSISDLEKYGLVSDKQKFEVSGLQEVVDSLKAGFDRKNGGMRKAPKFPLPSDWQFILHLSEITRDSELRDHALFTLDKMGEGGIYDHLRGGFARYSVDERWFAPHFEKMLYDNGQLLSLYANAYKISKKESYKRIVYQTTDWLREEMTSDEGGFFSAIDADSEGVEGKYYVWSATALKEYLGEDYPWYARFYGITEEGNWEHGANILHQTMELRELAREIKTDHLTLLKDIHGINSTLLNIRNNRVRPGTDDKIITSWNCISILGLLDAYEAFGEKSFLEMAERNAGFLLKYMYSGGRLLRSHKDGESNIQGYLEDYSWFIAAMIKLYQATFDEKWLEIARESADYTMVHFFDPEEHLFFFTSSGSEPLIARKKELFDNVIPSSNSQMARNLQLLGIIFEDRTYSELSVQMLQQVQKLVRQESGYMSNWGSLYLSLSNPTAEVVIVGKEHQAMRKEIGTEYFPNLVLMGTPDQSSLPLFEGRAPDSANTTIYVCYNSTCKLPVQTAVEAIKQLRE